MDMDFNSDYESCDDDDMYFVSFPSSETTSNNKGDTEVEVDNEITREPNSLYNSEPAKHLKGVKNYFAESSSCVPRNPPSNFAFTPNINSPVDYAEEDWDAECDDDAPTFMIPGDSLLDPYTTMQDFGSDNEGPIGITGDIRKPKLSKDQLHRTGDSEVVKHHSPSSETSLASGIATDRQVQMTRREWLSEIEDLYFEEKEDGLQQALNSAFEINTDPYDLVIYFLGNAYFDLYSRRPSIARLTLEKFNSWIRSKFFASQGTGKVNVPRLDSIHQERAMEYLVTSGLNYIDLLISAFALKTGNKDYQAARLHHLFGKGSGYKNVAIIAGKLDLQDYFEPKEIILPLLVLDKVQVIETYVGENRKQQDLFLKLMDYLCSKEDKDLLEFVGNLGLKIVDKMKFKTKTMQKISEKYVKKYKLDPVDYPHIFKMKNTESLQLLLRKKYQERKATGKESKKWDGLLEGAVVGNVLLQEELVKLLEIEYNDVEAALSWAKWCGVTEDKLPPGCKRILLDEKERSKKGYVLSSESSRGYRQHYAEYHNKSASRSSDLFYQLRLPQDKIKFVDSSNQLYKCMCSILKPGTTIGFDAEWVPVFGRAGTQERIAILQLATTENIFIIDFLALNESEGGQAAIKELLEELLTSEENLVIGYGVTSDFRILVGSYPYVKDYVLGAKRFIDLCDLTQTLFGIPSIEKRFSIPKDVVDSEEKGLSLLVKRCLGKYLDKTFQVSNWEKRPLLEEQTVYAALDAYCLLEIYDELKRVVRHLRLDVNMEPDLYISGIHPPRETNKRPIAREEEIVIKSIVPGPPRPPGVLKVVCDTMLQGLGRYLRSCGVDTIMLTNEDHHTKAVELSHKERRVILTKGRPYFTLRGYVHPSMCMNVPSASTKQQVSAVLTRYNVKVTTKDIFSRCQACNGDKYITISPEDMKKAYEIKIGEILPDKELLDSPIDFRNVTINNGVSLRCEYIQKPMLDKVDLFYCCGYCGKIFWEGSHFGRIIDQFKDVLQLEPLNRGASADSTIYCK